MQMCSAALRAVPGEVSDTQAGKRLQVRFKETDIIPMTEAGAALARGVLSDFQYQHVIQVSRFACGFWPVSERHLKIAALFFPSPSFFLSSDVVKAQYTKKSLCLHGTVKGCTNLSNLFQVQVENSWLAPEIHAC